MKELNRRLSARTSLMVAGILFGVIALFVALLLFMSGCSSPPTRIEQGLFNVTTNPPGLVLHTNVIPVTIFRTNEVIVTNVLGTVELRTNLVPVTIFQTNVVLFTNSAESYTYARGPGAQAVVETGTAIGNLFGAGGIVGTGLGALFTLWGYIRSKKTLVTAGNLAETIETMREFLKTLPNGTTYDNEFVNWMQLHQAEGGVLQQVMSLLQSQVSNQDAKLAAQQVIATIEALRNQTKA